MAVQLNISRYDRLLKRDPGLVGRIAQDLGCSFDCIRMIRWRAGHGKHPTRSDGIERVQRVNEWMKKEVARG